MAKTTMVPPADEHAVSFLGFAGQYQKAANLVCDSDKTLGMPIYFMYAHAIELALKAYLRAANVPIVADKKRKHHKITELFKECQTLGLKVGPNDVTDMGNVVALLDGANEEQGLRYFRTKGAAYPDLSWTKDSVERLLQAIEPAVKRRGMPMESFRAALSRPISFLASHSRKIELAELGFDPGRVRVAPRPSAGPPP